MPGSKRRMWQIRGGKTGPRSIESPSHPTSQSFETLLVSYLDALYATALRLARDQQQAEDLVQETCLRAWKHQADLQSQAAMKAWLFKILMNTFINAYRKSSREPPLVDIELTEEVLAQGPAEVTCDAPNPQDLLLNQCLEEEIQEAYDELHTDIRTVIWLADVEGFRLSEIAEILGCPPGTVASRLFRGRALLREMLHGFAKRRGLIKE